MQAVRRKHGLLDRRGNEHFRVRGNEEGRVGDINMRSTDGAARMNALGTEGGIIMFLLPGCAMLYVASEGASVCGGVAPSAQEKEGGGIENPTLHDPALPPSLPLDPLVPSFIFPQGTGRGKGKGRRANVLIGIAGERTNGVGSIWYRSTFPKAQQPLEVEPNSYNVVQRCEHAQALITAMHQPFLPLAANPAPPSTELAFGGAGQVRRGKGRSIMR